MESISGEKAKDEDVEVVAESSSGKGKGKGVAAGEKPAQDAVYTALRLPAPGAQGRKPIERADYGDRLFDFFERTLLLVHAKGISHFRILRHSSLTSFSLRLSF